MSDKNLRQRNRRGLLKSEQLHALARDLNYGKRGRITNSELQEQKMTCSCMSLILASIIYYIFLSVHFRINLGNTLNKSL